MAGIDEQYLNKLIADTPGIKFIAITDESGNIIKSAVNPLHEDLSQKMNSLSVSSLAVYGALKITGEDFNIGKPILILSRYENGMLAIYRHLNGNEKTFVIIATEPEISMGLLSYIVDEIASVL